jgi:DNA repair exonuclease SbcCD nuclease subunit
VLLVGNHDALHDKSVYHRFHVEERGADVQLLDDPNGSMVEVTDTDVVVWGRAMVEHEPAFRPLAGVPAKPDGRWGVVAGHGIAVTNKDLADRSSPIFPEEIELIDWDYVALGHHHAHTVLRESPRPAVYPGATASGRKGEAGVVLVTFIPDRGTTFDWVPLFS